MNGRQVDFQAWGDFSAGLGLELWAGPVMVGALFHGF
jgi:hypothetical protein